MHAGAWDATVLAAVGAMDWGRRQMMSPERRGTKLLRPALKSLEEEAGTHFWELVEEFCASARAATEPRRHKWKRGLPSGHPCIHIPNGTTSPEAHRAG